MQSAPMPMWLIPVLVVGFVVVFVGFWTGVVRLIGLFSGWTGLARRYRTERPVVGVAVGTMRLGWARYNHVAMAQGRDEGLALDVNGLFRPGHPPLCIPWAQVRYVGPFSMFPFWKGVHLELGEARVRLLFPEAAWEAVGGPARVEIGAL